MTMCGDRKEGSIDYTRRDLGKIALAAVPLARAYAAINSKFYGVQIGAITYSFNSIASDPEAIIKAMVEIGLGETELMSNHCEALAGAPAMPQFGRGGGGGGRGRGAAGATGATAGATGAPADASAQTPPAPGAGADAGRRGRSGGRAPLTPEQQAQLEQAQAAVATWRAAATADTWKAVRKKFNDAGI